MLRRLAGWIVRPPEGAAIARRRRFRRASAYGCRCREDRGRCDVACYRHSPRGPECGRGAYRLAGVADRTRAGVAPVWRCAWTALGQGALKASGKPGAFCLTRVLLPGGRALWFYPTIGAAVTAGVPWLTFSCPVCGPVRLGPPAHAQPAPGRCRGYGGRPLAHVLLPRVRAVRLGRPAHAQPAPGRCDLKPDLVGVLPAVNMRALGVRGLNVNEHAENNSLPTARPMPLTLVRSGPFPFPTLRPSGTLR